jgi:hypothetical protein
MLIRELVWQSENVSEYYGVDVVANQNQSETVTQPAHQRVMLLIA